jgi:hypothetical protein
MRNPFRYFNSSPEVIRLVVMMYVRYPLSLRNVEDLLAERGIDISHETVRFWWNRFGSMFAAEIRKRRVAHMRGYRCCSDKPSRRPLFGRLRVPAVTAGVAPPGIGINTSGGAPYTKGSAG